MSIKNKILTAVLVFLVIFGLTSCGTKKGEVSYNNFTSIVTVAEAAVDNSVATDYNGAIVLLGGASDYTNYDSNTGTGYLQWVGSDGETVKVTFDNYKAVSKEQTGLYSSAYTTPIGEKTGVWQWIILQLGRFTFFASSLFGLLSQNYYWLGLLIMTLVIRTIGWPVYAKSNDMSLKMQQAQPELSKVQEKYRDRKDQASQQRMQMETMEIYKKYKINFFGCLMPLMQMPIFIAMYQVVQRFPRTDTSVFNNGITVSMNTNFLWTNLGNTDWLPNLPLALLVGVLMFLSQWIMQLKTKKMQNKNTHQDAKAQQSQKTMKYFMYFMVLMMVYISIGNAGIAFYWIIGTSYQLFQSYLAHRNMGKRQEVLRRKM